MDNNNFDDTYDDYQFEEDKQTYSRMQKFQQRMQAEQAQRETNKVFQEALKEHGLSTEDWNALLQKDPASAQQTFKEHVNSYVGSVARKRDSKGRFLPGKAKPQHQESASMMGRAGREAQPAQHRRFNPSENKGTNEDMENAFRDFTEGDSFFEVD
jgi:hypothetical protein